MELKDFFTFSHPKTNVFCYHLLTLDFFSFQKIRNKEQNVHAAVLHKMNENNDI